MKEPLVVPPHTRSKSDDALDAVEDGRQLVAAIRLALAMAGTVVWLAIFTVIGVMYVVLGHTAGRLIGIGLIAFVVVLIRSAVRELPTRLSELEDRRSRRSPMDA